MAKGSRPGTQDVRSALRGLRIDQGITTAMLPEITFSPTLGIVAGRIDKLGIDIRSFHEPLKRSVQRVIAPSFRRNFDAGGRPAWEEFSAFTPEIQQKIYGVGPHSLLIKSGRLRRVMGQLNIWTINRTSAIIRDVPDSIWYARVHQAGYGGKGSRPSGSLRSIVDKARAGGSRGQQVSPIPARPFVMLQSEDIDGIQRVFSEWLEERIDRAWPS